MSNLPQNALRRARGVYRRSGADTVDKFLFRRSDAPDFDERFENVWQHLKWDRRPSARRLYLLAKEGAGSGEIVEIGSFIGNSTIFLALGSAAGGRERVHAVDPHSEESMTQVPGDSSTTTTFEENLRRFGVRERVDYHRMTSAEAAATWNSRLPVRLLYIDGLHTFDAVCADFHDWYPSLGREFVVLFDDMLWPEVDAAVRELRRTFRPPWFAIRGGQALFASYPVPLRAAGLP